MVNSCIVKARHHRDGGSSLLSVAIIATNLGRPDAWDSDAKLCGHYVFPRWLGPRLVKLGSWDRELSDDAQVNCKDGIGVDRDRKEYEVFDGLLIDGLLGEVCGVVGGACGFAETLVDNRLNPEVLKLSPVALRSYSELFKTHEMRVTHPELMGGESVSRSVREAMLSERVKHFARALHYALVCDRCWRHEALNTGDAESMPDLEKVYGATFLHGCRKLTMFRTNFVKKTPEYFKIQKEKILQYKTREERIKKQSVFQQTLPLFCEDRLIEYPNLTAKNGRLVEHTGQGKPKDSDDIYLEVFPAEMYERAGTRKFFWWPGIYQGGIRPMTTRFFRSTEGPMKQYSIVDRGSSATMSRMPPALLNFLPFSHLARWAYETPKQEWFGPGRLDPTDEKKPKIPGLLNSLSLKGLADWVQRNQRAKRLRKRETIREFIRQEFDNTFRQNFAQTISIKTLHNAWEDEDGLWDPANRGRTMSHDRRSRKSVKPIDKSKSQSMHQSMDRLRTELRGKTITDSVGKPKDRLVIEFLGRQTRPVSEFLGRQTSEYARRPSSELTRRNMSTHSIGTPANDSMDRTNNGCGVRNYSTDEPKVSKGRHKKSSAESLKIRSNNELTNAHPEKGTQPRPQSFY
ncbi:hypothetical protein GNI_100940 [Gregarina niphandrodes]|uniref:Uncharacterized protein n=1 Tax=Gregarina niphandrodes TaxID=110365 RepID=A0A023B4J3_GRENI|nr:hypothetical protein GNI_100940 [Gregarina niphandrodes]EZG56798.1 hypothetical protein GNI_100940 [Gregarina niphandrodes]|eukprot:XP_011131148.1 hypothetical protein GNI_100940 [Gregarina niphandrodes]